MATRLFRSLSAARVALLTLPMAQAYQQFKRGKSVVCEGRAFAGFESGNADKEAG